QWMNDPLLVNVFTEDARNGNRRNLLRRLCRAKGTMANWSDTLNDNLSRIEAARSASLTMLLDFESRPTVVDNIELGFIPWHTVPDVAHRVELEAPQAIAGLPGLHFRNMRERLLWINRADPSDEDSL